MLSPKPCRRRRRCFRVPLSCPRLSWRKRPPRDSQSIKTTHLNNQPIKTIPRPAVQRQESGPSVSENVAPDLGAETVRATTDAARRYMEIAARGGWPRLAHPVPVVWAYMTGWAEPDGMARFRSDIYGLDKGTRLPPAHETPMALRR